VSEQVCLDIRAANGVYASAKGLGRFYAGLGKTIGGRSVLPGLSSNTLQQFVDQSAPSHYDVALGRSCSYGLGFMVRLAEHRFGRRCSGSSFGHGGFEGLTFGLYDPEVDLSLALHHNGIVDGSLSLGKRREARVDSVYEYLGL
jgi:hypothetical protein